MLLLLSLVALCTAPAPAAVADTAPDDPYLPVVNATTNPASPEFANAVKAWLTTVAADVKIEMRDAGESIGVGKHLSDVIPGAPNSVTGAFNGLTETIAVSEYITLAGVDYRYEGADNILKHEMGHGLDYAAYDAQGQGYSQTPAFTEMYSKDLAEMPDSVKLQFDYYIQGSTPENPSTNGRSETFAEIFKIRYGQHDNTGDDLIEQYFDDTVAWEFELLPPPVIGVTTGGATDVTASGATLRGTVIPSGVPTSYRFDYGTGTGYGSTTPLTSAGSGSTDETAVAAITGLAAGTVYHHRLVAVRYGVVVARGSDQTFTTAQSPSDTTGPETTNDTTTQVPAGTTGPETTIDAVPSGLTSAFSTPVIATDKVAPVAAVSARAIQRLGPSISVTVRATSENLWATLTGSVSVRATAKVYKLSGVKNRYVARGTKATLKAKIPLKARAAISRALRRHRKVTATLKLRMRDTIGNTTTKRRTIKLKR